MLTSHKPDKNLSLKGNYKPCENWSLWNSFVSLLKIFTSLFGCSVGVMHVVIQENENELNHSEIQN